MSTKIGQEFFAVELPVSGRGSKKATLLALSPGLAARLFSRDTIFVPSIDRLDDDSTRTGPTAEFRRKGYQRPPEPARVRKIGSYYKHNDLLGFTTPIITSVRRNLDHYALVDVIQGAAEAKVGEAAEFERTIAIIDGQHRFRGVMGQYEQDTSLRTNVILLCVHNLSYEEETKQFDVINTTPKRLPKALTEWNKYGITENMSGDPAQRIRQIAVSLGTDSDSVWKDRVNLSGTGRDLTKPVTLEGLRRSTENMFPGSLKLISHREKLENAKFFWKCVAETFPEAWNNQQKKVQLDDGSWVETGTTVKINGKAKKIPAVEYRLTDLVGVASLAKIAGEILTESRGNNDPKAYIKVEVSKLGDVNWEKSPGNSWTDGQAGFAGQKGTYEALAFLRANGRAPWDDIDG